VNIAIDVDGTIDSFPRECQTMMSAFVAAGCHVTVLTGIGADSVTQADVDAKREYLTAMGVGGDCYQQLIVVPRPHAENKATAVKDNDIKVLFDNSKANVKACAPLCAAFLLWNSKEP
jgi:hypothetical protein